MHHYLATNEQSAPSTSLTQCRLVWEASLSGARMSRRARQLRAGAVSMAKARAQLPARRINRMRCTNMTSAQSTTSRQEPSP
jgi:hypothetical protein